MTVDNEILRAPENNIDFLSQKQIDIPNKVRLFQKKKRYFSHQYKYQVMNYANSEKLFQCQVNDYTDKFIISEKDSKDVLYTFSIKKRSEDVIVFKIKDEMTEEEKNISLQREPSILSSNFKVTFLNKATNQKEKLFIYSDDYRTYIYYDKNEMDGGALICKAEKTTIEKSNYIIEFSPELDKMFMFILILGITKYLRDNIEYWY